METRIKQLRKDAQARTPDQWYYNQYENGRLISQHAFPRKELAESWERMMNEEIESMIRTGAKMRPGVTHKVEEAKGWRVDEKEFTDFAEALLYKWTERPNYGVLGIF